MRPIDFLEIPPEYVTRTLAAVEQSFGGPWLNESGGTHRLQLLWQRQDSLSSIELVSLGDAILQLQKIDKKWINLRTADIKKNASISHGHVFEILGIAMMARGGMQISPTRGNAPGVDAVISFPDGYEVRLSVKNHDMSDHERFFRARSLKTRMAAHKSLRQKSISAQILIDANEFLTEPDWTRIDTFIEKIPALSSRIIKAEIIPQKVAIRVSSLPLGAGQISFSDFHFSDTFISISNHHKNEQKNFLDKVYKATSNLRKHTQRSTNKANVVFMRLHPTALFKDIEAYANELLEDVSSDPGVDGFLLYQPSITRDGNVSRLSHHIRFLTSKRFVATGHNFHLSPLIGTQAFEPSRNELHLSDGRRISLDGKYMYQSGDHFYKASASTTGLKFNIGTVGPGILTHAVINYPPPGYIFRGKFPPDEELLIL